MCCIGKRRSQQSSQLQELDPDAYFAATNANLAEGDRLRMGEARENRERQRIREQENLSNNDGETVCYV